MVNSNNNIEFLSEVTFTKKEIEEINKARTMPIVFDEDCPETTPEKAVNFKRVNPRRI